MEKVSKERLVDYIMKKFGFDPQQYGFQRQCNTQSAMVDLTEYILKEMDEKKYVVGVFIDLQKAFDSVDLEILLNKL